MGVIGTRGTIDSDAYQRRLRAHGLEVWAQACPLLVHVVEEGLADSAEAEVLARHYLAGMPDIDTLVLGCTHYPLLTATLQRVAGPAVRLVSSADEVAREVRHALSDAELNAAAGAVTHFVSGDILAYQHTAARVGAVAGSFVKVDDFERFSAPPGALPPTPR